ncbi:hypothetical protein [Paraliobacillus sp. X-1268]|uniref:hypothetical protein n=1 Tax=Paraliobacillus sp. X-1268 TaxID=2213193 RepID=UPI000E3E0612|nr:hypothetical protein [Paraliobacillus sp. X-1268]
MYGRRTYENYIDRPLFGATTKKLNLDKDGDKIGEMNRWFHPPYERTATSPIYDVNIKGASRMNTFEISQQSFSLSEGHHWKLEQNGIEIGEIIGSKGLKEKHKIELHSESFPHILIETTWRGNGIISINDKEIGETKVTGFLINTKYITETEAINNLIEPSLLAGIIYTFWSSHTQR